MWDQGDNRLPTRAATVLSVSGYQFHRLQKYLSPLSRRCNSTPPGPVLGLYMEEGVVCVLSSVLSVRIKQHF